MKVIKDTYNRGNHGLLGVFTEKNSPAYSQAAEIVFNKLPANFKISPHFHNQTKTIIIVTRGAMHLKLDGEAMRVQTGEYVIFDQGVIEEVVSVEANTENFTIHLPSIMGGDKVEVKQK